MNRWVLMPLTLASHYSASRAQCVPLAWQQDRGRELCPQGLGARVGAQRRRLPPPWPQDVAGSQRQRRWPCSPPRGRPVPTHSSSSLLSLACVPGNCIKQLYSGKLPSISKLPGSWQESTGACVPAASQRPLCCVNTRNGRLQARCTGPPPLPVSEGDLLTVGLLLTGVSQSCHCPGPAGRPAVWRCENYPRRTAACLVLPFSFSEI